MYFIDVKYLNMYSIRLQNFKQKKQDLWNCRCPLCGDSKRNTSKSRGYFFAVKGGVYYKCHNCGASMSLGSLIKQEDPNLYKEYTLERYKEGAAAHPRVAHKKIDFTETKPVFVKQEQPEELVDDVLRGLRRLDTMPPDHPAVKYVLNRKIPSFALKLLYFAPKFYKYVNNVQFKFPDETKDHPRLIIPFFNEHGKVFAFQGRAFGNEEPKYFTIKLDENMERIYGLERVDMSKRVFVVEGPIDSLFLPNSIAVSGSDFANQYIQGIAANSVIVFDNEPRNKEITKQIDKCINMGYNIALFPDTVQEKDINDMVKAGRTVDEIVDLINKNTFRGAEAKLKFVEWRKC